MFIISFARLSFRNEWQAKENLTVSQWETLNRLMETLSEGNNRVRWVEVKAHPIEAVAIEALRRELADRIRHYTGNPDVLKYLCFYADSKHAKADSEGVFTFWCPGSMIVGSSHNL